MADDTAVSYPFGERRIYYNNFAEHLLNAYNPNMTYPGLPHRWSDDDWRACIDMVASFGYNVFEFWLVPRLFCRGALASDFGRAFARQMNVVCAHARARGVRVEALCALATVGDDWHTYCPNVASEWEEVRFLWNQWTRRLSAVDIVGLFPGDPGACSRNGCTAMTCIDRSCEIAELVRSNLPSVEIEMHTWGPPFFGWGNIQGPADWGGEFIQEWQHSAWQFDKRRADESMQHLLRRLPDFPEGTSVAINLGFNSDGNPVGEQDARRWAREIARTHRISTWDFSLTEGENNVAPHYRFARLFEQRRRERDAAGYSGGICFTMSPLLNQLSLWEGAQSFIDPDADPEALAAVFYQRLFGPEGRRIVPYLPLFEVVKDWGNYQDIDPADPAYHGRMVELRDLLEALAPAVDHDACLHPAPEAYRRELLFFAQLYADLSGAAPDFDALADRYWQRVYAIYDHLEAHVDPRPRHATRALVGAFLAGSKAQGAVPGKWSS